LKEFKPGNNVRAFLVVHIATKAVDSCTCNNKIKFSCDPRYKLIEFEFTKLAIRSFKVF